MPLMLKFGLILGFLGILIKPGYTAEFYPLDPEPDRTRVISPGETFTFAQGELELSYPVQTNAGAIRLSQKRSESITKYLGFSSISSGLVFELEESGKEFGTLTLKFLNSRLKQQIPFLVYNYHQGEAWKHEVTSDKFFIEKPGLYFQSVDILDPAVQLVSTDFEEDSVKVTLRLEDNVKNLSCNIDINGSLLPDNQNVPCSTGTDFNITMYNNPSLTAITFSLSVDDGTTQTSFPMTGNPYIVPQKFQRLRIEANTLPDYQWKMLGFPYVTINDSLTLRDLNSPYSFGTEAKAAIFIIDPFNPLDGTYNQLGLSENIPPGQAVWVASKGSIDVFGIQGAVTNPTSINGTYEIGLIPGWNMITNPSLIPIIWPVSKSKNIVAYDQSRLKGLRPQIGNTDQFGHADTLKTFKGYFVFLGEGNDTIIDLKPRLDLANLKRSASGENSTFIRPPSSEVPVEFLITSGKGQMIRAGAARYASDHFTVEEEPAAPVLQKQSSTISLLRDRYLLETDLLQSKEEKVYQWQIVWSGEGKPGETDTLKWDFMRLPDEYRAWVISKKRNLKVPAGEQIVLSASHSDTLKLLAGPTSLLDQLPDMDIPSKIPVHFEIRPKNGHNKLLMSLPEQASVHLQLVWPNGKTKSLVNHPWMSSGHYEFEIGNPDGVTAKWLLADVRGNQFKIQKTVPLIAESK